MREWLIFVAFVGPNLVLLGIFSYQIIGKGLERITANGEPAETVFKDVADQLDNEKQPVLRALKDLGEV